MVVMPKKILLQVPEGLKGKVLSIAKELEKQGNEVLISCEPCYGACDLRDSEAKRLGCEKIIHYGHSKFVESEIPVEYEEMKYKKNIQLKEIGKLENFKKIGLISAVQFVDSLPQIKKQLEEAGKEVLIGKPDNKNLYDGQILGCNISAAKSIEKKIDCFLFLGTGRFHPIGVAVNSKKPVFIFDVEKNKIEEAEKERFLKQKIATIELARDAKVFGILISTKPGQMNLKAAEQIKKRIEKAEKTGYVLVLDEVKPEKLEGLQLEAYINTACPRIAIEDRTLFKKPILNLDEAAEVL